MGFFVVLLCTGDKEHTNGVHHYVADKKEPKYYHFKQQVNGNLEDTKRNNITLGGLVSHFSFTCDRIVLKLHSYNRHG